MKNFVCVLLSLLMCLSLAACVPAGGGTTPELSEAPQGWDFDNRFGGGYDSVAETDGAHYYTTPGGLFLYYYDKQTSESGVLCAKPECEHDAKRGNADCTGCVSICGTLSFWDGRLHYITMDKDSPTKHVLMSIMPDGSDKRKVIDVDLPMIEDNEYYSPQRCDYHRGKLYGWCSMELIDDAEPLVETCILSIDARTGKTSKIYSSFSYYRYETPSLYYFGRYVYFYLGRGEEGEDGSYTTYTELRRFDTETEEVEDVFISQFDGFLGGGMRIKVESEDRIYLMPESLADGEPNKLYLLSNGELSTAAVFDTEGYGAILDGAAFVGRPDTGLMEIRRFDGSLIYEGAWELDMLSELGSGAEASYHISSVFGDEDELLICIMLFRRNDEISGISSCLLRYDLTEEEPRGSVLIYDKWQ